VRCFVAIDLSAEVRAALAHAQAGVRRAAPAADVRWVDPVAFHLTLKFLGQVSDARVPAVSAALETAAGGEPAIALAASGLGAFPSLARARVVWAGITAGAPELARLAAAVDRALEPLGFTPEGRPFQSHLTIGRVRSPRGARALAAAVEAAAGEQLGSWRAEEVVLYESLLRSTGAVYRAVSRHRLQARRP
jgi:2'-5' RNA ligase